LDNCWLLPRPWLDWLAAGSVRGPALSPRQAGVPRQRCVAPV